MPAVEKQAARALSQGQLKHDPLTTTGADVVGAMAFTPRIGALLWRLKWGGDKAAVKPLAYLVARKIVRPGMRVDNAMLLRVVIVAIDEHINNLCKHCKGRGFVTSASSVVSICTHCNGSGQARSEDKARIMKLKCSENAYELKWRPLIEAAHNALASYDSHTNAKMREQLRWKNFFS